MRSVFAPEDIATLIAKFPPPQPTQDRPSLVRPRSNPGTLLKSDAILRQFGDLLKTSQTRISIESLPSKLGIDHAKWLFDCFHGTPIFSKDRQSLVPEPEQLAIRERTVEHVSRQPETVSQLATSNDLAVESLELLLGQWRLEQGQDQLLVSKKTKIPYVYTSVLVSSIESELKSIVANKASQRTKINLRAPPDLLLEIAGDAAEKGIVKGGHFENVDDEIYHVPEGFEEAARQEANKAYQQRIEALVAELESLGKCRMPSDTQSSSTDGDRDSLIDDVVVKYRQISGHDPVTIRSPETSTPTVEIWEAEALDKTIEAAKAKAKDSIESWWKTREENKSEAASKVAFQNSLFDDKEWANMLSSSGHATALDSTITDLFTEMEDKDTTTFHHLVKTDLLTPTTLHLSGIHPITDPTLKQHLSDFLSDSLKRDTIPSLLQTLQTTRLLLSKPRAREIDKFQTTAIKESKSLPDIQDAISKLTRKLKIEPPTNSELMDFQLGTIRKKVKGMKGMTRGSDLLQNLVWVLLAGKSRGGGREPALYVSAGKDTSRMIKLFFTLGGDEAMGRRLEGWRDGLKEGKEQGGMVGEMREVGKEVLRRVEEGVEAEG